jgi:predicted RNase H-like HicB family nuclease
MKRYSKTASVAKYRLPLVIKKEGEFFIANSPKWLDCYAQGSTIDEATSEVISVASSLIELYEEEGLTIPLEKLEKIPSDGSYTISFDVPIFANT